MSTEKYEIPSITSIFNDMKQLQVILKSSSVIIPFIFLFASIVLYAQVGYNLDYANQLGKRLQSECGNEYLEIYRQNYQIYNYIAGSNNSLFTNKMSLSFKLVTVAYFILTFCFFITVFADIYNLKNYSTISKYSLLFIILGIIYYFVFNFTVTYNLISTNIQTAKFNKTETSLTNLYYGTITYGIICISILILNWRNYLKTSNTEPFQINTIYFIFIIIYILIIVLLTKISTTSINLISAVQNNYENITTDIQDNIQNILNNGTGTATSMPLVPAKSDSDQLKIDLIQNIKQVQQTDGDSFILTDYKDNYWPYLVHQNGNELADVYALSSATNPITNIRTDMRNLRNDTTVQNATNQFINNSIGLIITVISIIAFMIFHFVYKHLNRPSSITSLLTALILLLAIAGPIYGWIMSIINKTY